MVDSIGKIREPERELEVFEDRQRRRYVRGMVLTRLTAAAIVARPGYWYPWNTAVCRPSWFRPPWP